jgi:hypothetical protein
MLGVIYTRSSRMQYVSYCIIHIHIHGIFLKTFHNDVTLGKFNTCSSPNLTSQL